MWHCATVCTGTCCLVQRLVLDEVSTLSTLQLQSRELTPRCHGWQKYRPAKLRRCMIDQTVICEGPMWETLVYSTSIQSMPNSLQRHASAADVEIRGTANGCHKDTAAGAKLLEVCPLLHHHPAHRLALNCEALHKTMNIMPRLPYRLIIVLLLVLLLLLPLCLPSCHRTVSYRYLPVQKSTAALPAEDQVCKHRICLRKLHQIMNP